MSLFVENRTKEKAEVSQVPQNKRVRSVMKDSSKNVGLPFENEVCLPRHSKISRSKCQGNKLSARGVKPIDTPTPPSGPMLGINT